MSIKDIKDNKLLNLEEFDLTTAKFLLELSLISYEDKETKIKSLLNNHNFTLSKFIDHDNLEAIIAYNDKVIVAAFPGTEVTEIKDHIVNIQFLTTRTDFGRVHEGFYGVYKKIKFEVYKEVLRLEKELGLPVLWTGHSLGGALAVLFSTFYKSGTVYTFGAPKVGDEKFCIESDKLINHFRINNIRDIFPFMPPWILGYKHSGNLVEFAVLQDVDGMDDVANKALNIFAYIFALFIQIFSSAMSFVFSSAWWLHTRMQYHLTAYYKRLLNESIYKITPSPYKNIPEINQIEFTSNYMSNI